MRRLCMQIARASTVPALFAEAARTGRCNQVPRGTWWACIFCFHRTIVVFTLKHPSRMGPLDADCWRPDA